MHNISEYLEQLGLSKNQIAVYTKLLKTGPLAVQKLAQLLKINRTSLYIYIDELIEKGVVIKIVHGSRSQIEAMPPEKVLEQLLAEKEQLTKRLKEQLPAMAQVFNTAFPTTKTADNAEIRHYKGRQGVKKIYEEALKAKEIRSYVNIEEVLRVFPENAELFDNVFQKNSEITMYEIVENSLQAKKRFKTPVKRERYFYKFLPERMKLTAQDILIYDNTVAIIHFKNKINGIVLHNSDLYNNFKLLFDFNWKILPE